MPTDDVSHGDIYRALGVLEGKLDALGQTLNQRNAEFSVALTRITDLEKTVAKGLGVALTCSIVLPLLIAALAPRIQLGGHHSPLGPLQGSSRPR